MAEEDLNAAVAHAILSCVASPVITNSHMRNYTAPGLHMNYFLHGVVGFLNFQGTKFGDFSKLYKLSLVASKTIPIAFLMADQRRHKELICALHVLSGLVPLGLAMAGTEDQKLIQASCAFNVICLLYYAFDSGRTWAWYTGAAAAVAYFAAPNIAGAGPKIMYPLCLSVVEYCAYRMSQIIVL